MWEICILEFSCPTLLILSNAKKMYLSIVQVPQETAGVNTVSTVLVDEEAVGPLDGPGCGAKIIQKDLQREAVLS